MRASELMTERIALVDRLTKVDLALTRLFSQPPSYNHAADFRSLAGERREIVRQMRAVGYQPWPMPGDETESKVS